MSETRDRLNQAESFAVLKLIEANGQKDGEFWVYNDGWSDERIADDVKVPVTGVAHRRKEVFGLLRTGRGTSNQSLEPRIDAIDVQLRALRVNDFDMVKRIEALEKAMSILLRGANDIVSKEQLEALKQRYNGSISTQQKRPV